MALWELEELQPPLLLGFIRALQPPQQFRGNEFLPPRTIDDIEFEYIKGVNDRPVMATIIGWDSEAPLGSRPAQGERVQGELPPIKRKERISEKEILRFLQPRRGTSDQQQVIRDVYDRTNRLVQGILARFEWLQMQALSEDKVVYNESGVIIQFDYGIEDDQQIDLITQTDGDGTSVAADYGPVWSDTVNATPVSDLMTLSNLVEANTGTRPARLVISAKAYGYLTTNAQLKGWTYPSTAPDRPLTSEEIQTTLARYNLPQISTYDAKVKSEAANGTTTEVRPMAENKAVLLPSNNVGSLLLGPTAESRGLLATQYAQQRPGIWANTYAKDEPPSEWVKACAVGFPTMPDVAQLAQMTLFA